MNIKIKSNLSEILEAESDAVRMALEKCGLTAERYAKEKITQNGNIDTGNLRNSISHRIDDNTAYVGTEVEYGKYIEEGTGVFYRPGRKSPWGYEDRDGVFHFTNGMKPQPFIKPAVADHAEEYKRIIESELKGE